MKRKMLNVFLTIVMMAFLLPVSVAAADTPPDYVPKNGGYGTGEYANTYFVVGEKGYPKGSVKDLKDGDTLDLTYADDYTYQYHSYVYLFSAKGKLTIIGDGEPLSFNGKMLASCAKDSTLTFKNLNWSGTARSNLSADGGTIIYEGEVNLPDIDLTSSTARVTYQPADESSVLNINKFYDDQSTIVFDGGKVNVSKCVIAGGIEIINGCKFTVNIPDKRDPNSDYGLRLYSNSESKLLLIKDSAVSIKAANSTATTGTNLYALGGSADPQYNTAWFNNLSKNQTVLEIDNSTVTVDTSGSIFFAPIGGVRTINIKNNSTVVAKASQVLDDTYSRYYYKSAIGGIFETINIENSTVTAVGGYAAGIGTGHQGDTTAMPRAAINITDSTVNASSINGAAIGSSPVWNSDAGYLPQTVDITISGNSTVVARSVNGAAIGVGMKKTTIKDPDAVIINPGIGGDWNPGNGGNLDTASLLSLTANDVVDAPISAEESKNLLTDVNTLTVQSTDAGTPVIFAESGVCAISAGTVTTDIAIIQNTLDKAAAVNIPVYAGDALLGYLHKDYKSIARTADAGTVNDGGTVTFDAIPAGTYGLACGSGTGALKLISRVDPLYSESFYIENGQINRFWTQTVTPISGSVKITNGANDIEITEAVVNSGLFADVSAVIPSEAISSGSISYQWYKGNAAIDGATGAAYTPAESGIYHCVVSGSQFYGGNVSSNPVSVTAVYPLWISGVQVTSDNASDVLGDGTVVYDDTAKTLTLDSAVITGGYSAYNAGIYAEQSLTVILKNSNVIGGDLSTTILDRGIHIKGESYTLAVKGTNRETDSLTVNITDTPNYNQAVGIDVPSGVSLENATVSISENEAANENYTVGIGSDGVTVKNCNLTLNGFWLAGIHAAGEDVLLDGSTIVIDAKDQSSPNESPIGIFAAKALVINDSDVTIRSGFGAIYSDIAGASASITGSTLNFTHTTYYGIYIDKGGITIKDTTGTLAGARPFSAVPTFVGVSAEASTDISGAGLTKYVPEDNNTYKYCKLSIKVPEPLEVPENLVWNGTTAQWDAVANASGYTIALYKDGAAHGNSVLVTGTSYSFNITEVGEYIFKVKALGDHTDYTDSGEATSESFHILPDAQLQRSGEAEKPFDPDKWYGPKDAIIPPVGCEIASSENGTFNVSLALADMNLMSGTITVNYYLKDSTGKVTAKSFENFKYDDVVPVIVGVEDGKTYCGAVDFTVNEENIASITVAARELAGTGDTFTVSPVDGEQEIKVEDKAGNQVVYRITVNDGHTHIYDDSTTDTIVEKCRHCDFYASAQIKAPADLTYNGSAHEAAVVYTGTLSCANNLNISYGGATDIAGAGDYTASISHGGKTASVSYTVNKAKVTPPTIDSKAYTGAVLTADIQNTDLYTVTTNNGGTDVGKYDVVLTLKDSANYVWEGDESEISVTLKFEITRAANEWMENPSIENWKYGDSANDPDARAKFGTVVFKYYDAQKQELTGVPANAGTYYIKGFVAGTDNYRDLESDFAAFEIEKMAVTISWSDTYTFVFDGTEKKPYAVHVSGPQNGDDPTITVKLTDVCDNVNAGTFTFTATGIDNDNYVLFGDNLVSPEYTIKPRDLQADDFKADIDGFVYTGSPVEPAVESKNALVTVNDFTVAYGNNINAGINTAIIKITGKGNASGEIEIPFTITKADYPVIWPEHLTGKQGKALSSVGLSGGFTWDDPNEVIKYGEGNTYAMTYTPADVDNYKAAHKDIAVKGLDVTAPTAEIVIGTDGWNSFFNHITFGLFFKDTQMITIAANDTESGIQDVAYHIANRELSVEEIGALTKDEWTVYAGGIKLDPSNKYVVYVRVIDNAGNIAYINSDGVVIDSVVPVISGIENGKDIYGNATFTVEEDYLDTVTIDGAAANVVDGKYTVPADNAKHTIVVTDQSGNKAEYTLTVYKTYTVTFVADGKEVEKQVVGQGKDAVLPEIPAKDGYTAAWNADGKNITADLTITAEYTEIPSSSEHPGNTEFPVNPKTDSPQTGDNSVIWLWVLVLLASGGAATAMVVYGNKRRHGI